MGPGLRRDLGFMRRERSMDVRDKVVAITGAARGLGQEFARTLAAAAPGLSSADINDCAETLALVNEAGPEGLAVKLDVTDRPRRGRWSRPQCRSSAGSTG